MGPMLSVARATALMLLLLLAGGAATTSLMQGAHPFLQLLKGTRTRSVNDATAAAAAPAVAIIGLAAATKQMLAEMYIIDSCYYLRPFEVTRGTGVHVSGTLRINHSSKLLCPSSIGQDHCQQQQVIYLQQQQQQQVSYLQQQITPHKTDDDNDSAPKCSCLNASLCKPLPHGPPTFADVHVYSDGGGRCLNNCTHPEEGWRQFDLNVVTTLVMMHGHPITVGVDGAVTVTDSATWPFSELICTAHASDTRVLVTVLPDRGKGPTGHSDPTGRYYQNLLGNATAVQRMADELTALVGAAGFDGVEFDFESIEGEMTPSTTFDFGAAHVAMIKQVSKSLKASQPHATVALTMDAGNLTDPMNVQYNKCYPVNDLSLAADQIFIMSASVTA